MLLVARKKALTWPAAVHSNVVSPSTSAHLLSPSRKRDRNPLSSPRPSLTALPLQPVRPVRSLNGLWNFAFLGDIELESFDPSQRHEWERLPVPSAFDVLPAYAGKRGAAVYETTFDVPAHQPARIEFGAVSMWGRVYIDGVLCHEQRCGFAQFSILLPTSASTRRTLTVLVDNRFDAKRLPMHEEKFDFYQYGGILRDVTCHLLPVTGLFLDRVQVTPLAGYASGEISLALTLSTTPKEAQIVAIQFDDEPAQQHSLTAALTTLTPHVPSPRVWSPQSPHLHRVRVVLLDRNGHPLDDLTTRFGLRRIEVRNGQLQLNGDRLILRGYNRHEWHPHYGPCTPLLQMVNDLQMLRDLDCNFVRGSHYPQDARFLDLCDELGFLVFEENLGWQQDRNVLNNPDYRRDHASSLLAMVYASYNHPCIILRGFLNEAESDQPASRAIYEESAALLRQHDPSRLVTYATDRLPNGKPDLNLDLVDLISINLYPGWYGCEGVEDPLTLIAPCMDKMVRLVDEMGFGEKPVFFSEIGAEGLYGWHDPHHDFFSEEYQAAYLATACTKALSLDRCCGIALWQFCDIRTYGKGKSLMRPRTFNNKGTVDEYRRPKLAYAAVKKIFSEK